MFVDLRDSLLRPKLGLLEEICLGSIVSSLAVACAVGRYETKNKENNNNKVEVVGYGGIKIHFSFMSCQTHSSIQA